VLGLRIPEVAYFFSGFGESDRHPIEAFDIALRPSRIHEYNLTLYSSILPKDIAFASELPEIPRGSEIPVVLSRSEGVRGEFLVATLSRALDKSRGGVVVETHAKGESEDSLYSSGKRYTLEEFLEASKEIARNIMRERGLNIDKEGIVYSKGLVRKSYGVAVAGVAFIRFRYL